MRGNVDSGASALRISETGKNMEEGRPFFSVIIPVYNRANTVKPSLLSVKEQSFTDFECLVIDDGSDDGEALAQVVADLKDGRFVYIRQENGGGGRARNRGFDRAKGRYIALLDSDDQFLPEKLMIQSRILREHSGEVLVYSRMIFDRGLDRIWVKPPRGLREGERVDEYLMCMHGKIQTSTVALPTNLARQVRFDENLPSSQDTDFAIRIVNAGAKVVFVEEPLAIIDDIFRGDRVSKQAKYLPLLKWIDDMRGVHISNKAYWAYRGWQCARAASYSDRWLAIRLYFQSMVRGVYPPKHAMIVAAQILVPQNGYQAMANFVVRALGKRGNVS